MWAWGMGSSETGRSFSPTMTTSPGASCHELFPTSLQPTLPEVLAWAIRNTYQLTNSRRVLFVAEDSLLVLFDKNLKSRIYELLGNIWGDGSSTFEFLLFTAQPEPGAFGRGHGGGVRSCVHWCMMDWMTRFTAVCYLTLPTSSLVSLIRLFVSFKRFSTKKAGLKQRKKLTVNYRKFNQPKPFNSRTFL